MCIGLLTQFYLPEITCSVLPIAQPGMVLLETGYIVIALPRYCSVLVLPCTKYCQFQILPTVVLSLLLSSGYGPALVTVQLQIGLAQTWIHSYLDNCWDFN